MSNHEECNCEQSLRLKREVEELKAELASTTTTQGGKGEPVARCEVCDWPLRERKEDGCVKGNCSFRPDVGSDDHKRIQKRRAELDAAKAPAVDESEPPIGYSAQEAGPKGQSFGCLLDSHGALEWTDWYPSRPAAVAACWAHKKKARE
jgi:hypothetical protein